MAPRESILSNALLSVLFDSKTGTRPHAVTQLLSQMAQHPQDYTILAPSSWFLETHADMNSKLKYRDLVNNTEFILSHVIRISALDDPRIRSAREYTTLDGKTVFIRDSSVVSGKGWKRKFDIEIECQRVLQSCSGEFEIGCQFHVVFLKESMVGTPKCIEHVDKALILNINEAGASHIAHNVSHNMRIPSLPLSVKFESLVSLHPELTELFPKFHSIMSEMKPRKCDTLDKLEREFHILMKRAMAILKTLPDTTVNKMLEAKSINSYSDLQLSVMNHLEFNVYDRIWPQLLRVSVLDYDNILLESYDDIKYISISQIGLSNNLWQNVDIRNDLLHRLNLAIKYIREIQYQKTATGKCLIIMETINILTTDVSMKSIVIKLDADSLLCLLLYVICHAAIPHLGNHLIYLHTFFNKQTLYKGHMKVDLSSGYIGYILSTLEVAVSYFSNCQHHSKMVKFAKSNKDLWELVDQVQPSRCLARDVDKVQTKENNKLLFKHLQEMLNSLKEELHLDDEHYRCSPLFARNANGQTYISLALTKRNEDLMYVLFEPLDVITLDDILEDIDLKNRSLFTVALELNHPFVSSLFQMLLSSNTPIDEFKKIILKRDSNGRNLGHLINGLNDWTLEGFDKILQFIEWDVRDDTGMTPFMSIIRCYDHSQYHSILKRIVDIQYQKYHGCKSYKFTLDHLDSRGNTMLHAIRSPVLVEYILKKFDGNELDVNRMNDMGVSALGNSIKFSNLDKIKILIADPRTNIHQTDQKTFTNVIDLLKIDRETDVDQAITALVENKWRTEKAFICIRGKFELELGFTLHLKNGAETIHIGYHTLKMLFKALKMENKWIPFEFDSGWIPSSLDVTMKGNIQNSNKLKINHLVANINWLWECLKETGIISSTSIWKQIFERDFDNDEAKLLQIVNSNLAKTKKRLVLSPELFRKSIVSNEEIHSYLAFVDYSIGEFEHFQEMYQKMYYSIVTSKYKVEAKDYCEFKLIDSFVSYDNSNCDCDENGDISVKLRILCMVVRDMINVQLEMKNKIFRWIKIYKILNNIKGELLKVQIEIKEGKEDLSEWETIGLQLINNVLNQLEAALGNDRQSIEFLRTDIAHGLLKSNEGNKSLAHLNTNGMTYGEKKKANYINKLVTAFLNMRAEIVDLDMNISKGYESIAEFVSNFYQFRVQWIRDAFKKLASDNIQTGKEGINKMNAF